jgi:hypothetical protein
MCVQVFVARTAAKRKLKRTDDAKRLEAVAQLVLFARKSCKRQASKYMERGRVCARAGASATVHEQMRWQNWEQVEVSKCSPH